MQGVSSRTLPPRASESCQVTSARRQTGARPTNSRQAFRDRRPPPPWRCQDGRPPTSPRSPAPRPGGRQRPTPRGACRICSSFGATSPRRHSPPSRSARRRLSRCARPRSRGSADDRLEHRVAIRLAPTRESRPPTTIERVIGALPRERGREAELATTDRQRPSPWRRRSPPPRAARRPNPPPRQPHQHTHIDSFRIQQSEPGRRTLDRQCGPSSQPQAHSPTSTSPSSSARALPRANGSFVAPAARCHDLRR